MPAFSHQHASYADSYSQYNPSAHTLAEEDDYGSTAHLAMSAAPLARPDDTNSIAAYNTQQGDYGYQQPTHTGLSGVHSQHQGYDLAYGDSPAYTGHDQYGGYGGYHSGPQRTSDAYDYGAGRAL